MALKDNIIQDFFNSSKSRESLLQKNKVDNLIEPTKKRFRVFDDPTLDEIKLRQSQDKAETNLRQSRDEVNSKVGHKKDKPKTQPKTVSNTNSRQTQDKLETIISFFSLVGLQRQITFLIYETCKASRDKKTPPLSVEHIATSCKTTKSSIQKTVQRLEQKGIILRSNFKNGRGGWTQYELSEHVFQDILHNEIQYKFDTNLGQTQDKGETEPRTELRTNTSSSSGINILNKNTTTSEQKFKPGQLPLSEDWNVIDIIPLQEIGFTKTHLLQVASQNKLPAKVVQDSIYAFAFDLQKNNKRSGIKGDPINFFMGILRNGKPYLPPSNYESPQDEAMRLYLEQMRTIEQRRAETENEVFELSFNDWFHSISDEEKKNLIPLEMRHMKNSALLEAQAKEHFKKELWVSKVAAFSN